MVNIERYNNDSACWQAKAVLAYVRHRIIPILDDQFRYHGVAIEVDLYDNGREEGYIFSVKFWARGQKYQRNYAVYQHRVGDGICVLISPAVTEGTPTVQDMWSGKPADHTYNDYDWGYDHESVVRCGKDIIKDMTWFIKKYSEEDKNY